MQWLYQLRNQKNRGISAVATAGAIAVCHFYVGEKKKSKKKANIYWYFN